MCLYNSWLLCRDRGKRSAGEYVYPEPLIRFVTVSSLKASQLGRDTVAGALFELESNFKTSVKIQKSQNHSVYRLHTKKLSPVYCFTELSVLKYPEVPKLSFKHKAEESVGKGNRAFLPPQAVQQCSRHVSLGSFTCC